MKFDLSYLERGAWANLARARASRQRGLAADKSRSSTRMELEAEAAYWESVAQRLDDAEEPTATSETEPVRVQANDTRDIDYIDRPPNGKVAP